ncbi:probable ATP-dependent RNA helicase DDX4 [Hyperolius riggenbachi]|uniref:probable ATP-dependent RNA helicase DDX4 n=1 Tax=Hyperolius riggenbachi TaxID=752182 RepID=UPI0035A35CB8
MADEDWESELDNAPAGGGQQYSSVEPVQNNKWNSFSSNTDVNENFGSSDFGSRRGTRSDRGGRGNRGRGGSGRFNRDFDTNDNQEGSGFSNNDNSSFGDQRGFQKRGGFGGGNDNEQTGRGGFGSESSGFGRGRRGNRGGSSFSGDGGDSGSGRGFGRRGFGGDDGNDQKDYSSRDNYNSDDSGFGKGRRGGRGGSSFSGFGGDDGNDQKGFSSRDGFNSEDSGFGRGRRGRGGRGSSFSSFGGDDDGNDQKGFSSRDGFNSEDSGFGRRGRGGRGSSFSSDGDSGRGGGGFGRGGFRGKNEDVGVESGKAQDEFEKSEGPKVTYVPPAPSEDENDIFKHYQTGINFDKYDDIVVDVSGDNPPPAILTFAEANLPETLSRNVQKAGYVKLTPIQKHSIPIVLAGRDLMACAQTGSGKTAAFLLPILAHMMVNGVAASQFSPMQEPEAIIIAPTRELINQIYLDARKFSYGTVVRPVVVYGGTMTGHSIRQISQGCNVLCATPGRLLDIIKKEKIGLSKIQFLVLDEADRMLDMGFLEDIYTLLRWPGMPSRENRQTLMFSATFPMPIQRLARDILKVDYLFVVVGQVGGACSDVEQQIIEVDEFGKKDKLLEILQNIGHERTMVFVKTKKKADFIATLLCQEKIPSTSIHGDREQREREAALSDFRTGRCPVIVATSVAARGLDIENVLHVINYDIPGDIDEYVHRIGRTGRCGNTGQAISFFDRKGDEELKIGASLIKVLSDAHQEVPAWLEEISFGGPGKPGYNPLASTFASVDQRNKGGFHDDYSSSGFSQPAVAADDDENWG